MKHSHQNPIIVFDCDGVLLVSNRLKTRIFGQAAAAAGFDAVDVAQFSRYVAANFGTSRYKMFENLLNRDDLVVRPKTDVATLTAIYASKLYAEYVRCPTTPGMLGVLRDLQQSGHRMFVVSGSDQAELRQMMAERHIADFFGGIYGSPTSKTDNLVALVEKLGGNLPLVFIGDAEADYKAASAVGARFIYMDFFSTAKDRMRALESEKGFERIRDLRVLPQILKTGMRPE